MIPDKVFNFISSEEYFNLINDLLKFLKLSNEDDNSPKVVNFVNEVLRENKNSEEARKIAPEILDFLNDQSREDFLNYFEANYRKKINELWVESLEDKEVKIADEGSVVDKEKGDKKATEESYEEREKRYLELMRNIFNLEPSPPKTEIKEEIEEESKKIITFEGEEGVFINWPTKEEKKEPDLSDITDEIIVIRKEEKEKPTTDDFLDLSNL